MMQYHGSCHCGKVAFEVESGRLGAVTNRPTADVRLYQKADIRIPNNPASSSATTLHSVAGISTASKPAYPVNGNDIQMHDARQNKALLSRDKRCDINARDDSQKSSNQ